MCEISYTLHSCGCWVPFAGPKGNMIQLCDEAKDYRLGGTCPTTKRQHEVKRWSQGMCNKCLFQQVTK
ncbi:hypothetical protein P280DRAFT_402890 [Massarina eburnea CBS 473.64]|uniref:Uncharacterized protein n=1 Tax=Massarina eburnea CBS 473.64 TaxID=1395130 RepID=A0A6A6RW33_9PLEO|nr:hypothetical protein P280DRAFT_402890 [Massarina eburnea CBS 473.64]